ncbi:hypothetical protein GGD71_006428 [Variovorax guangxiensis]|uniref:Uncharacterized protein n=1 Tax=Variovorax guangxiensis TaxID=1775474 RepID=A0A840FZF4_9BURK|nr:hypothetical protein [Variovorax guangxiensis]
MPNAHTRGSNIELREWACRTDINDAVALAARSAVAARASCWDAKMLARRAPKSPSGWGFDRNTVNNWRGRYARDRITGLHDELRPDARAPWTMSALRN